MSRSSRRFVVCLRCEDEDDLQVRKLYELIPDEAASEHGQVRIMDDSGEDYLYPASWFAPVEMSSSAEQALVKHGRSRLPATPAASPRRR